MTPEQHAEVSLRTTPQAQGDVSPSIASEYEAKRYEVDRLIAELTGAGALDEGSGDALDRLIDTWHAEQASRIREHFLDRQVLALKELGKAEENLTRAEHRLSYLRSVHADRAAGQ
jgi:hypothetical protein